MDQLWRNNQERCVDKMPTTDNEWDRLLAEGALSGPEADAMWDKVHARVVPRPSWVQRLARVWFVLPVPLAAAAVLLFFIRSPEDGFTPRGVDVVGLEATCGAETSPCRTGQPLFLRMAQPAAATLYVAMKTAAGTSLVTGPVAVPAGVTPLSVKLVPDTSDVTSGITLLWWTWPAALEAHAVAGLLRGEVPPDGVLTLKVQAAL